MFCTNAHKDWANTVAVDPKALSKSGKAKAEDKSIQSDIDGGSLSNFHFSRLVAKNITFKQVDFRYSSFDSCYLRGCTFDTCNFTGAKFVGTNFYGAHFLGCTFDYTTFERTDIDDHVLSTNCPARENLKLKFARSLRMNYQQLGNAQSANKAIEVELEATRAHLLKAWHSNESYYRKKYTGAARVRHFISWLYFMILDWTWGNGESSLKLARAALAIIALLTVYDAATFKDPLLITSYRDAFREVVPMFLGIHSPSNYTPFFLSGVTTVRLIMFGFLMSIIIKRFNRR
ncbi:pentapeptide repeat-containing protein [Stenotrophomonas rhizophila]|uniref:pentapeptide repeat-containing protein n=1 Tax=Stenotrophomonas rhizophila TaxID=216778 RepID=UPI0028A8D13B|nr:pentapeptide repeat-containing protein [Stenotrophomonas rhizophila]